MKTIIFVAILATLALSGAVTEQDTLGPMDTTTDMTMPVGDMTTMPVGDMTNMPVGDGPMNGDMMGGPNMRPKKTKAYYEQNDKRNDALRNGPMDDMPMGDMPEGMDDMMDGMMDDMPMGDMPEGMDDMMDDMMDMDMDMDMDDEEWMQEMMAMEAECLPLCNPMVKGEEKHCEMDCDGVLTGEEHPDWCRALCTPCAECWGLELPEPMTGGEEMTGTDSRTHGPMDGDMMPPMEDMEPMTGRNASTHGPMDDMPMGDMEPMTGTDASTHGPRDDMPMGDMPEGMMTDEMWDQFMEDDMMDGMPPKKNGTERHGTGEMMDDDEMMDDEEMMDDDEMMDDEEWMQEMMAMEAECGPLCNPKVKGKARSCENECDGVLTGETHPAWCMDKCSECAKCWGLELPGEELLLE